MPLAAWQIQDGTPRRLQVGAIELEKNLETWIEKDIGLIDAGLLVIQRQLHVDGGILDLLCVDLQGRATVVEIKKGKLVRETIAQGIDYAASVALMPVGTLRDRIESYLGQLPDHPGIAALLDPSNDGQREVAVVVVGVGRDPGLHRMIDFLGQTYNMPIRAITFDVFELDQGQRILVREETEPETTAIQSDVAKLTAAGVIDAAGGPGSPAGRWMLTIVHAIERNGLYARPYKWSFMATPMQNKARGVIVFGRWSGTVQISHNADALAEFFPIDQASVEAILGPSHTNTPILTDADAQAWAAKLDRVFGSIETTDGDT